MGRCALIRMISDNVLVSLDQEPDTTAGGIAIPKFVYEKNKSGETKQKARQRMGVRYGTVLAVGDGHHAGCKACGTKKATFLPTSVKVGERVVVHALAGQSWDLDVSAPRQHHKPHQFETLPGMQAAEYRIVREDEILGLLEGEDALPDTVREPRAGE